MQPGVSIFEIDLMNFVRSINVDDMRHSLFVQSLVVSVMVVYYRKFHQWNYSNNFNHQMPYQINHLRLTNKIENRAQKKKRKEKTNEQHIFHLMLVGWCFSSKYATPNRSNLTSIWTLTPKNSFNNKANWRWAHEHTPHIAQRTNRRTNKWLSERRGPKKMKTTSEC